MQLSLEQTIRRSPHFDEKAWGAALPEAKLATQYEIIHKAHKRKVYLSSRFLIRDTCQYSWTECVNDTTLFLLSSAPCSIR